MSRWGLLLALGGVGLAGCGGGGGGGSGGGPVVSNPTPPSPPAQGQVKAGAPPSSFETAEYRRNWGLATVGASGAYSYGATGADTTVAVIDSGIATGHVDFAGAIHAASRDMRNDRTPSPALDDAGGHGTMVAGIVGARKNSEGMHGLAFESQIMALRVDAPGSCDTRCSFLHSDVARATSHAVANGAQVLNYSMGGSGNISTNLKTALSQAAAADRILVFAAGNSANSEIDTPASFVTDPAARGLGIAVGAVDSNLNMASFSNHAGEAMEYYLVAPGVSVRTTNKDGGWSNGSGTSFAAPYVAGAAAALHSASPWLSSRQVVDLLLTTAADLGTPGIDPVYGRGLLDLNAALSPQGTLSVPTGDNVADGGELLERSGIRLGAAFGDAMAGRQLQAVFLDGYDRPFAFALNRATARRAPQTDLSGWLSGETVMHPGMSLGSSGGMRLSFRDDPLPDAALTEPGKRTQGPAFERAMVAGEAGGMGFTASHGYGLNAHMGLAAMGQHQAGVLLSHDSFASPYLSLSSDGQALSMERAAGNGVALRYGLSSGELGRMAHMGEISKRFDSGTTISVQMGGLVEHGSILDSAGDGAFSMGGRADTQFAGVTASVPLGDDVEVFGNWTTGWTDASQAGNGLLRNFSGIRSQAMGIGLAKSGLIDARDRLAFALSQPLKVVSGSAVAHLPVGRDIEGNILRESHVVGLRPSGTQTDAEISWHLRAGPKEELTLNLMTQFQPGHDEDAAPEFLGGIKYQLQF
ncbi:S8 family peptidase [Telmatospirillum sp. J64-1]|uniref:S8 family peptidase n=1 Tax=Telmatospirillum sp. J64-1 TaxID=2502183 RepID=UPI00115CB738|nr:S8 family peptidase [Telmatospirillum sp. J64-1]